MNTVGGKSICLWVANGFVIFFMEEGLTGVINECVYVNGHHQSHLLVCSAKGSFTLVCHELAGTPTVV